MYEPPIAIIRQELHTTISEKRDDHILATIKEKLGCEVNKEELIKALAYDRNQYEKGFRDGMGYMPSPITRGDLIRRMTDEELANEIYGWVSMYMPSQLRNYLEIIKCSILEDIKQKLKEDEE